MEPRHLVLVVSVLCVVGLVQECCANCKDDCDDEIKEGPVCDGTSKGVECLKKCSGEEDEVQKLTTFEKAVCEVSKDVAKDIHKDDCWHDYYEHCQNLAQKEDKKTKDKCLEDKKLGEQCDDKLCTGVMAPQLSKISEKVVAMTCTDAAASLVAHVSVIMASCLFAGYFL